MAVVKANATGMGWCDRARPGAGRRLRRGAPWKRAGAARRRITAPIVLLEGVFSAAQLQEAAHHGLELVVHDALQLELLEQMRGTHRFVLWIKIDTGMNRPASRRGVCAGARACSPSHARTARDPPAHASGVRQRARRGVTQAQLRASGRRHAVLTTR